jgi:hypothetical protein
MISEYRYKLDESNKKHTCPCCSKNTFVWYFDTISGNPLPSNYGRCDREINCGYHLNPYRSGYGKHNPSLVISTPSARIPATPHYIPAEVLKTTLAGYDLNVFLQNLLYNVPFPFDASDIERVIALYYLGTISSGYRKGAITFPFIDLDGKIRAIQAKQFNEANHTTGTDFLHSIIERQHLKYGEPLPEWLTAYLKNKRMVSCLFGEHMLKKYPYNPVALVEAPKSAIYGTLYFGFPESTEDLLWLAVYNVSSLNFEKCKVLKGRKVFLFPDLSKEGKAFDLWKRRTKEFSEKLSGSHFRVSDLLEKVADENERLNGVDIADVLIQKDWRKFRRQLVRIEQTVPNSEKGEKGEALGKTFSSSIEHQPELNTHAHRWDNDIAELESFFKVIPGGPIRLNVCELITDPSLFVKSHLNVLAAQNGNERYMPYLERLKALKQILSN